MGLGTLWCPLLGTAFVMLADEGLREFQQYRSFGLGLVLPVLVVFLPGGIAGTAADL